jgi:hypothetical protein
MELLFASSLLKLVRMGIGDAIPHFFGQAARWQSFTTTKGNLLITFFFHNHPSNPPSLLLFPSIVRL